MCINRIGKIILYGILIFIAIPIILSFGFVRGLFEFKRKQKYGGIV